MRANALNENCENVMPIVSCADSQACQVINAYFYLFIELENMFQRCYKYHFCLDPQLLCRFFS